MKTLTFTCILMLITALILVLLSGECFAAGWWGEAIMLLFIAAVFFLTVLGAVYFRPSPID